MLHFFHNFKISCKGNKKHSNNQIKSERYGAHLNLIFIIHTCNVFNRLNAILPHASLQFPSRPCHSPHASCHSPHALKGQKLLAQGIRPGYSCPHAWRPVGEKALYGAPNLRLCFSIHPRTGYGILPHVSIYPVLVYPIKEYIFAHKNKTNMDKSIHSHLYHQVIGRLRSKREDKRVTQVQLADKLGVNQNFISKIETCDRRLDLIELRQICQVLGISFVDFVAEVERDILSKEEK